MFREGLQKLFTKRGSYKVRVFRSILLLIVSMVLIFGVYTYYDYLQECRENAAKESKNLSERLVSEIDEKLTSIKQYYTVMSESEDLSWVLENDMNYSDYSRYKAASEVLGGKSIFSDYVQNFTFVNFKTGWVLSNKGMYPTSESKNLELLKDIYEMKNSTFKKN